MQIFTNEKIKEIAEQLERNYRAFYHKLVGIFFRSYKCFSPAILFIM